MAIRERSIIPVRLLSLVLSGLLLATCDESQKSEVKNQDAANQLTRKFDEDTALLKDLGRAEPELERRLLDSMKVEDGIIFISVAGDLNSYVLPATSSWLISCGVGLSVSFGTSVASQESDAEENKFDVVDSVKLTLATAVIDKDQCAALAPKLGKRLKGLLQGSAPSQ